MSVLKLLLVVSLQLSQVLVAGAADGDAADQATAADRITADQQALSAWQVLVGDWRGVGQPKRGSNRDAWREECEWSWHFADGRAELVADVTDGRFFKRLQLQPGEKPGQFSLLLTPRTSAADAESKSDAEPIRFVGTAVDGALVLTANEADGPARVTIRTVADGDRLIVLYERAIGSGSFVRQGEVASTRKGSAFATAAAAGRECVVTGGLGTIAVEHEGRTYYVCCGGCRDLFNDDPAGVLEDYRQRKETERAEKEKNR
jgi:hypothetical protein